jgi:hypothetical protein
VKVLIISEGKHELGGALETIVRRLTGITSPIDVIKVSDPALRVHHAKGPGYFKKAIRCLLYASDHGYDALVLLIDQDDQIDRRRQLSDAQEHLQLSTIPRAMGVAVITFDAWMLADERALATVLSHPVQRQPDPERTRDAKGACSALRDEAGSDLSLADLYAALAAVMDLDLLEERCPQGFEPFAHRARRMAGQLAP